MKIRSTSFCVANLVLGAALVLGQTRGTPAPPSTGGGNTTTTPTPTTTTQPGLPTTPQQPSTQQQPGFPEMQRPIFLSGKVVMDDGTPPPDPVVIERVCNGIPRPEGYTDLKGHFSFQLGQSMNMMPDASYGSNMDYGSGIAPGNSTSGSMSSMNSPMAGGVRERDLMGCELRANLAGFRSESVNLAGHRMMDNPDIGTIILHRMGNVEGLTISATSLMAPKDARKAYEKALEATKKQKWDDAQKSLQKAVDIYPKYASAWYQLGLVSEQRKDVEGARKAYAASLAADSKFVSPYMQLAGISMREQKWQDVADTTDRVIRLNSVSFPRAYFFNALANYELRKLEPAEKSAAEGQKLDTEHRYPQIDHLLGVILAEKRDFKGAAENLRLYLKFVPNAKDSDMVRKQLTEVEKLAGAPDVSQQKAQE